MTVGVAALSRWEYVGDDVTDTFPYTSKIFDDEDLEVYINGSLETVGFEITGVGEEEGGNVVFTTPPDTGVAITIVRAVPDEQPTEFPLGGPLPSTLIEQELDRRTIVSQQRGEAIERILQYNISDHDIPDGTLPTLDELKGKALTFNATTGAPEVTAFADLADDITSVGDGLDLTSQVLSVEREGFSIRNTSVGISQQIPVTLVSGNRTLTNTNPNPGQDRGRLFWCTAIATITLPELVAPWPEWFQFYVHNATASSVISLNRTGSTDVFTKRTTSEVSWPVRPGETVLVIGDRENRVWRILNGFSLDDNGNTFINSVSNNVIEIVCMGNVVGTVDPTGLSIIGDISATGSVTGGGQATSFTGEVRMYVGTSPPTGWLLFNGDSIGSSASSADQNDDAYEALYTLFWNSMANAQAPVSGGRGVSAAADFAANKTLTMPDPSGRVILGTGQGAGLANRVHGSRDGAEQFSGGTSYGAGGQCCVKTGTQSLMQPWLALNFIVRT